MHKPWSNLPEMYFHGGLTNSRKNLLLYMFLVLLPISASWSPKFGFSWSWFCGQLQSILVLCNSNLCAVLRNVLLGTGVGPILWFCYNLQFLVSQKFQNKTTHDSRFWKISKALPGFLKELAFQGRFFDLFFGFVLSCFGELWLWVKISSLIFDNHFIGTGSMYPTLAHQCSLFQKEITTQHFGYYSWCGANVS